MVAEVAYHIAQVVLRPYHGKLGARCHRRFVKPAVVAVLAFGCGPFVERLHHDHQSERVTELHLLWVGHVVRCADGIGAHGLEHEQLVAKRVAVYGSAERAQIVVETDAAELALHAVKEKTFTPSHLHLADAEDGAECVHHDAVFNQAREGGVEVRGLGRPQMRTLHGDVLCEFCFFALIGRGGKVFVAGHNLPVSIENDGFNDYFSADGACNGGGQSDVPATIALRRCHHPCAPNRHVKPGCSDEMHATEQTGAGIPSAALVGVVEADGQQILAAVILEIGCEVQVEAVISVGPDADALAVEENERMGHGTVDEQMDAHTPVLNAGGCSEAGAIPPRPRPRQSASASGLPCGNGFAVLFDGHLLQIISA